MQVTPLVRHLRAHCPLFNRQVSGGIDWDSIESSTRLEGLRAHVVVTSEDAEPSPYENVITQTIREEFDVCVEIPQHDERGQVTGDQVDAIRRELCLALVGFRPTAELDPIQYGGRDMLVNNRAKAVYRFAFFTGYQLGRNTPDQPAETWHELELDGLLPLEGLTVTLDAIDPADPNRQRPGPDGRAEATFSVEVNP